jgi:hypothetical protein
MNGANLEISTVYIELFAMAFHSSPLTVSIGI